MMAVISDADLSGGRSDERALSATAGIGNYDVVTGLEKERSSPHLVVDVKLASSTETNDMALDTPDNQGSGDSGAKSSAFDGVFDSLKSATAGFSEQAGARAREYTGQGKDRTVDALDNVASLVSDAAAQIDEKLGEQYGGYVRQAAEAVSGFADTLREKDADDIFDAGRDAIRSSPAIAIAAAAAVGFVVARVVKAGFDAATAPAAAADKAPAGKSSDSTDPAPTA
jgi:ElaB/YqjD/DUF883 family membrane-anchored ribosome-binding protein